MQLSMYISAVYM